VDVHEQPTVGGGPRQTLVDRSRVPDGQDHCPLVQVAGLLVSEHSPLPRSSRHVGGERALQLGQLQPVAVQEQPTAGGGPRQTQVDSSRVPDGQDHCALLQIAGSVVSEHSPLPRSSMHVGAAVSEQVPAPPPHAVAANMLVIATTSSKRWDLIRMRCWTAGSVPALWPAPMPALSAAVWGNPRRQCHAGDGRSRASRQKPTVNRPGSRGRQGCRMILPAMLWLDLAANASRASASR
jgi:hypothetical protein